jgi:uncharacterized protein
MALVLTTVPDTLTICRLAPDADLPAWAMGASFWSVTRTPDELSVVVAKEHVPAGVRAEGAWRVAEPLARARINLFAISTFDTDYILVASDRLDDARRALSAADHIVR